MSATMLHALREVAALVERHGSLSRELRESCALRVLREEMARLGLMGVTAADAAKAGR